MIGELLRDLRYGVRLLRRSAGFTTTAVLSLAFGIGGATAVFTLVNAIVLRTLPVPEPRELYLANVVTPERSSHGELFSGPLFQSARDELAARHAGELAAATGLVGMQLQPDGESIPVRGNVQLVSGEYFTLLRQQAQYGRLLTPADNVTVGGHSVAVVSDAYWRRVLGGTPEAIGRQVAINGTPFTIVGITRPRFFGTTVSLRSADAWIPFMMQPVVRYASNASNSGDSDPRKPWPPQAQIAWLDVFARVPAGRSPDAAASAMTMLVQREREAALSKDASDDDRASIRRAHVSFDPAANGVSGLRDSVATPLFVLLAMVGVLLVIACGNVAGLLLSRAAGREREMAIRLSIGAGRSRLVRQLLAESVLLALAGGCVGVTFAVWARDALLALLVNVGSSPVPADLNTALDWRVLAFSAAVSMATGIACGVLPAFRVTRVPVSESLKQQSRAVGAEGGGRGLVVGKALVTAQMAFCLLLLVVAGLFGRSLRSLTQTNIGFDRDHVLAVRVDVRGAGYGADERQALYRRVIERIQAIPGVQSASFSANGPLGGSQRISSLSVEGLAQARSQELRTNEEVVTDRYFDTVGLHLIEGRLFGPQDRDAGSHASVINASMARRFFPRGGAVGRRWDYGRAIGKDSNVIIGVVEDARYVDLRKASPNMAYHLSDASPDEVLSDIEIRTSGSPGPLGQTVRETLSQLEPRLPIVDVAPLSDRVARGTTEDRMVARLTTIFGALALLLASLGLYGTISYGISRRVAELGLRMALGADRRMVLMMILREALTLVVVGAAAGIPLAFLAARSMSALLYGVGPADPSAFVAGCVTLLAVSAVAAYLPAHRASRIEPMVALGR
ncbi:MAG TPA: ABC transporter permease [Vicinamibacterales bacterium]|jgi:predicted permease|nr:ABC transporter permease [Vicinamibacterales bacterium]